jgi:hypothetical protein
MEIEIIKTKPKKKQKELILKRIEELKSDSYGYNSLCNISGVCESIDSPENKEDGYTSNCYYCGAELEIYKGDFYHYSAFYLEDFKENYKYYQTHNGYNPSGPCTEEEREIEELEELLKNL